MALFSGIESGLSSNMYLITESILFLLSFRLANSSSDENTSQLFNGSIF